MLVGEGDGRKVLGGNAAEDRFCLRLRLPYHNRHTILDDASLLDGNLLQGVAKKLRVVKSDVGNDGEFGQDDIGGVKSTAHTHFNNGNVDFFLGKVIECHSHSHFKERELKVGKQLPVTLHKIHHLLLRNHLAIDTDALAEVDKMRRRVKSHLVSCLLQDGSEEMADRPLAVGAGHMDAFELEFGVAESLHHVDGRLDVGLISGSADAVIHRQLRKHII